MGSKSKVFSTCMMLLGAKAAHPQTYHIPCGITLCAMKSTWNAALKKKETTKNERSRKRQTIWKPEETDEVVAEPRLDDLHYNQSDMYKREYARTWSNYPDEKIEEKMPKLKQEERLPLRRRPPGERPSTAHPWDEAAQQFIKKVDPNSSTEITRSKRVPSAHAKSARNYKFEITSPISDVYEPDKLYKFYY